VHDQGVWLVVPFACLAALLFALAAMLQQRAARAAKKHSPTEGAPARGFARAVPTARLMSSLVRERIWLAGWLVNLGGFLAQAVALHLGSVEMVQPILVLQLLFSLPLTALARRTRVRPSDWVAGALVCAGVGLFLSYGGTVQETGDADRSRVLMAGMAAGALVAVLLVLAAHASPTVHVLCVSVAAGLCFAFSAVLMKLTTEDLLHRGVPATAVDWVGYALAGTTLLGLLLGQDAYATGSLAEAIAAMTITNPCASYVLGVLCYDTTVRTDAGSLAAGAGAAALLTMGVIGLSRSPLVKVATVGDRALQDAADEGDLDAESQALAHDRADSRGPGGRDAGRLDDADPSGTSAAGGGRQDASR
jgi:drug/metabolite transporter (DMT)-like permease